MAVGKLFVLVGAVLLLHAGYSAVEHRSLVKLAEEEYDGLPSDVVLECVLGSMLCCCGILAVVGDFKDTKLTTELNSRTMDMDSYRRNFMVFNHRGSVLYPSLK